MKKVENNRHIAYKGKVVLQDGSGWLWQLGTYSEWSEMGEIGGDGVSSKNEISPKSSALPLAVRVGGRGLGL